MPLKSILNQKRKRKAKEEGMEPTQAFWMESTQAFWERADYIKRRTEWMWRMRPFIMEKSEQCSTCQYKDKCHRVPLNERLTSILIRTGKCPSYKSIWKKILSDEGNYDWGF